MSKVTVKFKKLHPDAVAPSRKTEGAAGWDLCALGEFEWWPQHPVLVRTGIAVEIPPGYVGLVSLRSSVGAKGFIMPNAPGIIDSDYRGEIKIAMARPGDLCILRGERIAQLVIHKLPDVVFEEVEELSETAREAGGFGSTGR